MDPYLVLRVSPSATTAELRRAYLARARATHPDHGGTAAQFREVAEAWQLVRTPLRRAVYTGAPHTTPPTPTKQPSHGAKTTSRPVWLRAAWVLGAMVGIALRDARALVGQ